jgi:hypothetical protein
MKIRRPRSLNGLILVGFGLVALPLLLAAIWALVSPRNKVNALSSLASPRPKIIAAWWSN